MAIHSPVKATRKPGAKAATKKPSAKSATKKASPVKAALDWQADLRPHLNVLSDAERRLVLAVKEGGRKPEEVGPELGLDKPRFTYLQASKKLNQAARGS